MCESESYAALAPLDLNASDLAPQRAVLHAWADAGLARDYALKGGLVLQHVYGSPRRSDDVDLAHVDAYENRVCDEHTATLQSVLDRIEAELPGAASRVGLEDARVKVNEWSRRLPSVHAAARFRRDGTALEVGLDVALCEPTVATVAARVLEAEVRAQALEDAIADKLKTLVQQRRRHTVRHTDVFDLWYAIARAPLVADPALVRHALEAKLALWPGLEVGAGTLERPDVIAFAEQGYHALRAEQPDLPFVPFDHAWGEVARFLEAMGLG